MTHGARPDSAAPRVRITAFIFRNPKRKSIRIRLVLLYLVTCFASKKPCDRKQIGLFANQLSVRNIHRKGRAGVQISAQYSAGDQCFHTRLQIAAQRPRTVQRIIPALDD